MLGNFTVCRERFRLRYIEGLELPEGFNHRTGYGDMWHLCEEIHHAGGDWQQALREKALALCREHRNQQWTIEKWYQVCKTQFPLYLEYWKRYKPEHPYRCVVPEQVFNIPLHLPSGRTVWLRGKMDGVNLVASGTEKGVWLQENKTKGDIDEQRIQKQLSFDLQTMFYQTALTLMQHYAADESSLSDEEKTRICPNLDTWKAFKLPKGPPRGVMYNVIRRPLSGGKGTIKQLEARTRKAKNKAEREQYGETVPVPGETDEQYYGRLAQYIKDDPGYFFMRWDSIVGPSDVTRFIGRTLTPLLEQVCDWYDCVTQCKDPWTCGDHQHWQHPYGVYNVMNEGGSTEYDEYLWNNNEVGLVRTDRLFKELG